MKKKAVNAARESDLPEAILKTIEGAQVYAEGRGVRLEVRTSEDVGNVVGLSAIKMANWSPVERSWRVAAAGHGRRVPQNPRVQGCVPA